MSRIDDLPQRVERMWKYLNSEGIYTIEQLEEAIAKLPPIDIGFLVSPIPKE